MNVEKSSAIVTGGAGALGRAIATYLRDQGSRVLVLDRDRVASAAFAGETGIEAIVCDLASADETDRAVEEAWGRIGPITILVNAVGLIHSAPLINIAARTGRRHKLAAWREVLEANLTCMFLATVSTVDRMVATRTRGVIVNFSSIAAEGNAGQGAYSAAKAGVSAATRAWAKELGMLGIRFVAIAPGFIDTPSTRQAMEASIMDEWVRRTPLRRLGSIEAITSAVSFAISNDHLTGKVIEVDGGLTL